MSARIEQIRAYLAEAGGTAVKTAAAFEAASYKEAPHGWDYPQLVGRLVELSGLGAVASLTAAFGVVLDAQQRDEPVAWITLPASTFYPPDVADSGVDLAAVVVVRAPDCEAAARAADRLVRCGGFGLVVLDLGQGATVPMGLLGRLVGLAQRHDTAILCVTEKRTTEPSLGSVVSLRAEALRVVDHGRFGCRVHALKDKRRGPGWSHAEAVLAPPGLR